MDRRDFKRCLGAAASMLLPAAKVVDAPKVVMDPLIATLQWESRGGMRVNFKVMAILVPMLSKDRQSIDYHFISSKEA